MWRGRKFSYVLSIMWSVFISATFGELPLFRSSKDCLSCCCCRLTTCKNVERCVLLQIGLHTHDVSGVSSNALCEWLVIIALCFFHVDDKRCGRNRNSQNYDPVYQFAEMISNSSISEPVLGINLLKPAGYVMHQQV